MIKDTNYQIKKYSILAICIITTVISPWWTVNPFSFPKSLLLTIFTLILIYTLLNKKTTVNLFQGTPGLKLTLIFPFFITVIFIFNDSNKYQQVFGYYGRNAGFLTLLCFYLLFVFFTKISSKDLVKKFISSLIVVGVFFTCYSTLQPYGFFEITSLASKNLQPYGFFGNINFQSFFIGLALIYCFFLTYMFYKSKLLLIYTLLSILLIYGIWKTQSEQGFIVVVLGLSVFILIKIISNKSYIWFSFCLVVFLTLSTIFALGLFNLGPLSNIIFQDSVKARTFYWQAGIIMASENPILGVGLDSFGDFWGKYRSSDSVKFLGADVSTNSSHNFFIDIAANSGVFGLLGFVVINLVILFNGVRKLITYKSKDDYIVILFSSWIAFQVHNFISVPNIGINIWFWVISGLVMGYRETEYRPPIVYQPSKVGFGVTLIFATVCGLVIHSSQILEFSKLRSVFIDKKFTDLEKLSEQKFITSQGLLLVSLEYKSMGNLNKSLQVNRVLIQKYPNFYPGWELLKSNKMASSLEINKALERVKFLNPYSTK